MADGGINLIGITKIDNLWESVVNWGRSYIVYGDIFWRVAIFCGVESLSGHTWWNIRIRRVSAVKKIFPAPICAREYELQWSDRLKSHLLGRNVL